MTPIVRMTNTLFTIKWRPTSFCNSQIHVSNTVSLYFILFHCIRHFLTPYKMVFTEGLLYFLRTSWWQEPQMVLQMKKKIPKSQSKTFISGLPLSSPLSAPGQMPWSFLNSVLSPDQVFPGLSPYTKPKTLLEWWSPYSELIKGIWKTHQLCIEQLRYYHKNYLLVYCKEITSYKFLCLFVWSMYYLKTVINTFSVFWEDKQQ